MDIIEKLHLEAITSVWDDGESAFKSAEITKNIAVEFAEFCENQYFYSNVEKMWSTEFKIYDGQLFTTKELYQEFMKQYEKNSD